MEKIKSIIRDCLQNFGVTEPKFCIVDSSAIINIPNILDASFWSGMAELRDSVTRIVLITDVVLRELDDKLLAKDKKNVDEFFKNLRGWMGMYKEKASKGWLLSENPGIILLYLPVNLRTIPRGDLASWMYEGSADPWLLNLAEKLGKESEFGEIAPALFALDTQIQFAAREMSLEYVPVLPEILAKPNSPDGAKSGTYPGFQAAKIQSKDEEGRDPIALKETSDSTIATSPVS